MRFGPPRKGGPPSIRQSLPFLADVDPEQPLVVVSHGGTGRVIRGLYGKLSQDEMLILEQPQDAFHVLRDGQIGRIDSGA